MNSKDNKNYQILDKIIEESTKGRGDVVWINDPRHPNGGYYVEASDTAGPGVGGGNADEIERYLRSS